MYPFMPYIQPFYLGKSLLYVERERRERECLSLCQRPSLLSRFAFLDFNAMGCTLYKNRPSMALVVWSIERRVYIYEQDYTLHQEMTKKAVEANQKKKSFFDDEGSVYITKQSC